MKNIINKKIKEHKVELEATQVECEKIKSSLPKIQQEQGLHAMMTESNKMLVLKDKVIFHRACVLCLEELLEESQ